MDINKVSIIAVALVGSLAGPKSALAAPGDFKIIKSFPAPQVSPDGLEFDGKYLWSTECQSDVNFRLDPDTGKVLGKTTITGINFDHLAWDGSSMWGTHAHTQKVHRLAADLSKSIEVFTAPTTVMGIAWDGEKLWVLDPKGRQIYSWKKGQTTTGKTFKTPGSNPCGMGWDGKCLWAGDLTTKKYYQIDPATGKVVLTIDTPGAAERLPTGFTWDGKHIWIADEDPANPTLYKLDVEFLKDGPCGRAAAAAPDAGPTTRSDGGAPSAGDAASGSGPSGGCSIGSDAASSAGSAVILLLLLVGLAVRPRRPMRGWATLAMSLTIVLLSACAGDGSHAPYAYIPNAEDGTVFAVDTQALVVKRTIPLSDPGGTALTSHGIAAVGQAQRLFVGDASKGVLKIIDTVSFAVIHEVDLGIQIHGVDATADGARVIVTGAKLPDRKKKLIFVIDSQTNAVIAEIDAGAAGHSESTPDSRFVFVSDNDTKQHRIVVIDMRTNEKVAQIVTGPKTWPADALGPHEIAFSADGSRAYIADDGSNTVSVLDTSNPRAPTLIETVAAPGEPHGIAVSPTGEIWISNQDSKEVVVFDAASKRELARVSTAPQRPKCVVFTKDGRRAFVTLSPDAFEGQSGQVAVFDAAKHRLIAQVAIGKSPHAISFDG